jgi:selenocysteine lyase/cysteine desulfurase
MNDRDRERKSLESYRDEFPVTQRSVYLDHAGIAPLSLSVRRAAELFLAEATDFGSFRFPEWMERVEEVRKGAAQLINAPPEDVAFVKSTSHGLSIVAEGLEWQKGDEVLVYEKEFPSNVYPWLNLERKGVGVKYIPSRDGKILIENIAPLIGSKTKLLTISSVQFSNGFRIDLKKVGELCRANGILLCVDAIQSLGALPMNVTDCNIDFLAADGHKWLLSTEGTGIFYCRNKHVGTINPPLIGWKSVQNANDFDRIAFRLKNDALRFEEGSSNTLGIIALGAALDLLFEVGIERIEHAVLELGALIREMAELRGLEVKTPREEAERGGITSIAGDFDSEFVRDSLRKQAIMVNVRDKALRISPHFYNTREDIVAFFEAFDRIVGA